MKSSLALLFFTLTLGSHSDAEFRITEFLALNSEGPVDKDGSYSPWIEIQNFSAEAINLKDWYLTDNADELTKWKFPSRSVGAGERLVVHTSGKDFTSLFSIEIHTSFTFSDNDDYLALVQPDGETIEFDYHPPKQKRGVSYGLIEGSLDTSYFSTPTPGAPNTNPISGIAEDPRVSVERGFFEEAFEVTIETDTPDGTILYTTDGKEPSKGTIFTGNIGTRYEGPISIDQTTVLRAVVIHPDLASSEIETKSYIFPDDVIQQSNMRSAITQSAEYGPRMEESLAAIPSISLVLPDPTKFNNDDELRTSVELLNPDGTPGFQVDAGASWFGGYFTNFAKKNFRLYFRRRHGEPTLQYPLFRGFENGRPAAEEFDALNLRTGSHDMVERGAYLSNRFTDDTLIEMGHAAPHGRFVHLYLNGTYWGQYHLRERWNDAFAASYHGGDKDDYDAINGNNTGDDFLPGESYDGTDEFWQEVLAASNDDAPMTALQGKVDLANYIDFMLVWLSGNSESEFQAIGSKKLGVPFTFYLKDADGYLRPVGNRLSNRGPAGILANLQAEADPDFQILLADRIHRHYVQPGGAFTPEVNIARHQRRVDELEVAFLAEAARWNYRTPDSFFSFHQNLVAQHFPNLTQTMLNYFRQRGWYDPEVIAPTLNQYGGQVEPGFLSTLKAGTIFSPQPGEILYTLDGSDPRLPGGEIAETALIYEREGTGLAISGAVTLKARTFFEGQWSALTEASYHVGKHPEPGELVITEVHYRPSSPSDAEESAGFSARSDFEFIELYNASSSTLSLSQLVVTDGIEFDFAESTVQEIAPGNFALVVLNRDAFEMRYGTDLPVVGQFADGKLSDDGETVQIALNDGTILMAATYGNASPWPKEANGDGFSLTLRDPMMWNEASDAANWVISSEIGGSPGRLEGAEPPLDIDEDGDGFPAFLEVALGTSDQDPASGPDRIQLQPKSFTENGETDIYWSFSVLRDGSVTSVQFELESSTDLKTWDDSEAVFTLLEPTENTLEWRSNEPITETSQRFLRLRVSAEGD